MDNKQDQDRREQLHLSPQQWAVLNAKCNGKTDTEIASNLHLLNEARVRNIYSTGLDALGIDKPPVGKQRRWEDVKDEVCAKLHGDVIPPPVIPTPGSGDKPPIKQTDPQTNNSAQNKRLGKSDEETNEIILNPAHRPTWPIFLLGIAVGIVGLLILGLSALTWQKEQTHQFLFPATMGPTPTVQIAYVPQTVEVTRLDQETVVVPQTVTVLQTQVVTVTQLVPVTQVVLATPIPGTSMAASGNDSIVNGTPAAASVTVTPAPSATPPPVSPLDEGKTFANQGAELRLVKSKIGTNVLLTYWRFTNNTGQQLSLKFSDENFTAYDNMGRNLDQGAFDCSYLGCRKFEQVLAPGQQVDNIGSPDFPFRNTFDASDCKITEITIVVTNITPRIPEARWRVPIKLC